MNDAQDLCKELYIFIDLAPRRLAEFKKIQQELTDNADGRDEMCCRSVIALQSLCATCFTVRTGAYRAVVQNFKALVTELKTVSEGGRGQVECKASGLLDSLLTFKTFFALNGVHTKGVFQIAVL